ncbi:MAG: hypothetical protein HRU26_07135 [Psychroserpens sp.]|nr:hypothetical protein [Psychroserpens sp.]
MNLLYEIKVDFIKDTKESAKLFFQNSVVEVRKDEVKMRDYIDFPEYVWKEQIIDRDYNFGSDESDFKQFVKDISGPDQKGRHDKDYYNEDRFNTFRTTIGYLLHSYKRLDKSPAVILYDENSSETMVSGGTGKGLLYKAVDCFKDSVTIDGKSFDSNKDFAWQMITNSTQFIMIDDIKKTFNFENIFSVVTNGITVNQKNKPAFFINPEDSPKIMLTSNYVVGGGGSSHERRRHEVELYNFYHAQKTPFDRFNKQMYADWDDHQWHGFNNFMIGCVQFYLNNGLTNYNQVNIKSRRVTSSVGDALVDWAADYYSNDFAFGENKKVKNLFDNFKEEVNEIGWNQKKFTNKLIELLTHWQEIGKIGSYNLMKSMSGSGQLTVNKVGTIADSTTKDKETEPIPDEDLPF